MSFFITLYSDASAKLTPHFPNTFASSSNAFFIVYLHTIGSVWQEDNFWVFKIIFFLSQAQKREE